MAFTRPKAAQINFDLTNISDPLIRINSKESGSADKDAGIVIERGSDTNVAIIYDESEDQFAVINTTETGTTSGNVTITSYADIKANAFYGDGSNLTGIASSYDDSDVATYLSANGYATSSSIIASITDSAPSTLDTLNELAAALGDDANFSTTVTTSIATKLPLAGGSMTGNLNMGDNVKAMFGADSDLQIYHDGHHSYVTDQGSGNLRLRGSNFVQVLDASGNDMIQAEAGGAVDIYHNGNSKIATTSTGVNVTGTVVATSFTGDGSGLTNISASGINLNVVDDTSPQLGGDLQSNGNDITFGDNDKAIFGAGSDLQIYHDGSNSYIIDNGTGDLVINTNGNAISLNPNGGGEYGLRVINNGAVNLYHDNALKLATTATGVAVTGNIVATGATGGVAKLRLAAEEVHGEIEGINIGNNFGGLAFKTNSNGTTAERLRIDSDGNVGIGVAPSELLHIKNASGDAAVRIQGNTRTFNIQQNNYGLRFVDVDAGSAERMRIDSSGNVGIGTAAPAAPLDIAITSNQGLLIDATSGNNAYLTITNNGSNSGAKIGFDNASNAAVIGHHTHGNIIYANSSGNVGIGTASPATILHVQGADPEIVIQDTNDTGDAYIRFKNNSGTQRSFIQTAMTGNVMLFGTGTTEHMRLTAGGNLNVGKTADGIGTAGLALRGDVDVAQFTRDGNPALEVNRLSNDGSAVRIMKDGSEVGSIGSKGGDLTIGTGAIGIRFEDGTPAIVPFNPSNLGSSDGNVDLGKSSSRFKDAYFSGVMSGTATSARYADLAERYTADADYEPGTVMRFGGEQEMTMCTSSLDRRQSGIVTTNPAHLMNDGLEAEHTVDIALQGRVPCKVEGYIRKGNMMVPSETDGHARAWREEGDPPYGTVIGKSLEDKDSRGTSVIEVVVGVR